jgi:hypothetical protein
MPILTRSAVSIPVSTWLLIGYFIAIPCKRQAWHLARAGLRPDPKKYEE